MEQSSVWQAIWDGLKDLGRTFKFWNWRKVHRADIPEDVRARFEQFGEDVLARPLSVTYMNAIIHGPELDRLFNETTPPQRFAWLKERHQVAERREDRLETVEVAILLFLFLEVVHDFVFPLFH
jgi:hypothetical protein